MKYKIITKDMFKVAGIRADTEWAGGVWVIVKTDGSMGRGERLL